MGTQHIENNGPNTIYVGGKMIAPNEGRDIDERDLPPEYRKPAVAAGEEAPPSLVDLVGELRAKSVKAITAELGGLTQEALDLLDELENTAETPRKGVLSAISNEQIKRADQALLDAPLRELLEGNVASVKAALAEFGADTLVRLAELEGAAAAPRKGVLAAIADEQIARADAALNSDPL